VRVRHSKAERSASTIRELTRDARELRRRAAELSAPSTFAASAKLARAAAAKEKARALSHTREGFALRSHVPSHADASSRHTQHGRTQEVEHLRASAALRKRRAPTLAKAALQLGVVAALWGAPVLSAPGPPLGWPLDGALAAVARAGAPPLPPGAVGALPYALLCGRVASLVARVLLPT
jgi:hypothetical protein